MTEEARDLLNLPQHVLDELQHAREQFDLVILLFKAFEKAKFIPPRLKALSWTLFVLARGAHPPHCLCVCPFVRARGGRGVRVCSR